MSQNTPWLSKMQLCSTCGKVVNFQVKDGDARERMCELCEGITYGALKTYVAGDADLSHLEGARPPKGYMFSQKIIKLFAQHIPTLRDLDGFRRWWTSHTTGRDYSNAPSIDRFLHEVLELYNQMCEKNAPFMRPADESQRSQHPRILGPGRPLSSIPDGSTITQLPGVMTRKLDVPDLTPLESEADIPADPTPAEVEAALPGEPTGEVPPAVEAVQEKAKPRGNKKKSPEKQQVEA